MTPIYKITPEAQERQHKAYSNLRKMIELKQRDMPHFSGPEGERSFLDYINDSEGILNGYTKSRAASGKDDWQSNIQDNITRAKVRAIAASVGLKVPDMHFTATNSAGLMSKPRADLMHQIVKGSFMQGNATMQAFLEVWQLLAHGTVFLYEGYLTGGAKRKIVESYDTETGEVKTKEEYVRFDGKPVSILLNPQEFFWWDFYQSDIQKQPRIAWIQRYSKGELELEFSKFPNYKYIRDRAETEKFAPEQETRFYRGWSDRVDMDRDYEVLRLYSIEDDTYEIWINGVEMLSAPMLWGDKEKYYPFAKAINEPFANTNFFVGVSLPGLLEPYQTAKTDILNTMVDKLYRSLVPPMLVGLQNRDLLDIEDEMVNEDNRYYVPDVNAVKPFPYQGIQQADLAVLALMDRSIELLSVDRAQMGVNTQGEQPTARAAIIADERARQLKGALFMALEDLWLQKNRLRVPNILTNYIKDKAARKDFKDKTITVPDVIFPDGSKGTLDIHVADKRSELLSLTDIEAREQAAAEQGIVYKLVSMTKDYLDEWVYGASVVPESLHNQDKLKQETNTMEKIQRIITLFPETFIANKDKFLEDVLALYGERPDDYEAAMQQQPAMPGQEPVMEEEQPPAPQEPSLLGLQ